MDDFHFDLFTQIEVTSCSLVCLNSCVIWDAHLPYWGRKRFAAAECCMPWNGVVLVLVSCRIMVNCNLWRSKLVWIAWYWQWRVTYAEFWLAYVSGVICLWIWCSVWNVMSKYWLVRSRWLPFPWFILVVLKDWYSHPVITYGLVFI